MQFKAIRTILFFSHFSISLQQCTPGTYVTAGQPGMPPGCNTCGEGFYSTTTYATACSGCGVGTYSLPGASACTNCLPGTYSSTAESGTCYPCDTYTYASAVGSSSCKYCALGTYAPTTYLSTCYTCTASSSSYFSCETCFLNSSIHNLSFVEDYNNKMTRQLSLTDGSVSTVVAVGNTVYSLFFNPSGTQLYATNFRCLYYYQLNPEYFTQYTLVAGNCLTGGHLDGPASSALFQGIYDGTFSPDGHTLYLCTWYYIRYITDTGTPSSTWTVGTLLGTGTNGCARGTVPFASAYFLYPQAIYASLDGNYLLILDAGNHVLFNANLVTQTVSLIAGSCFSPGHVDGDPQTSMFSSPQTMQVAPDESFVVVADKGNCAIRMVTLGPGGTALAVSTIAGSGTCGHLDGLGTNAQLGSMYGLGLSPTGSLLYVADSSNNVIRIVDLSVSPVTVNTFSGSGVAGSADGPSTLATYKSPRAVKTFACPVVCPLNHYVIVGSTVCTACPPNSVAASRAITCTANIGYYVNGSATSAISTVQCASCGAGTYVQVPCSMSSPSPVCTTCQSGTYTSGINSLSCSACPAGTYGATSSLSACTACPPNSASAGQASTCTANVGYYIVTNANTSTISTAACPSCTAGKYIQTPCSMSAPSPVCASCQSGTYTASNNSLSCSACPAGTYGATSSLSACMACPPNSISTDQAVTCTANAGFYIITNANTSTISTAACPTCIAGKYIQTPCSMSLPSPVCASCQIGTYSASINSLSCAACPAGTYASNSSLSACTACQPNTYAPSVGSSACSTCSCAEIGFYPRGCGASSAGTCVECENNSN